MADKSQAMVTRSLRAAGYWTFKAQDAVWTKGFAGGKKLALPEEPGKADLIVARNDRALFIEVKDADESFSFSDWRDNQRAWAADMKEQFGLRTCLAITIGRDRPHYSPDRFLPQRLFIVPRPRVLQTEILLAPYQASLPYLARAGYRKEVQAAHLDAIHLWAAYELPWGRGCFTVPPDHFLTAFFSKEVPCEEDDC